MNLRGKPHFEQSHDTASRSQQAPLDRTDRTNFAATIPQGNPSMADMQLEVSLYIESISAELRAMARTAGLDALSYFLEMARIEASIQVERRALSMSE